MTRCVRIDELNVWLTRSDGDETHAVRNVSMVIETGKRYALVGESGCGKSTILLAIMGLLPPSARVSGDISLDGRSILGERLARAQRWATIAMVFQGAMSALNPVKTVGWQIDEPLRLHTKLTKRERRVRAEELLETVGIPPARLASYPHQLSGGMRQRVCIAMALACRPSFLLADEPTTALDVIVQDQVLHLLERLCVELGLGLCFVTHDIPVVARLCETVGVMKDGAILETGSPQKLHEAAVHAYTRSLYAEVLDVSA